MKCDIHIGQAIRVLRRKIPEKSVNCCVTSPPYWDLRDYGVKGQIGHEKTVQAFIRKLVLVFREVRRVLRDDGTCWINMGDCHASNWPCLRRNVIGSGSLQDGTRKSRPARLGADLKDKDLVGQPWMLAFALRRDGWYLREDIIWHKPNPMPESVRDRPTTSHEYIFLLSKSPRYYYDQKAIREPVTGTAHPRGSGVNKKIKSPNGWDTGQGSHGRIHKDGRSRGTHRAKQNESFSSAVRELVDDRNKRSVWTVPTYGYEEAHFATYPPDLIKPCILAGCPAGGWVLDPFAGSFTTGVVAKEYARNSIMIELNPEYARLGKQRVDAVTPGLPLDFEPEPANNERNEAEQFLFEG